MNVDPVLHPTRRLALDLALRFAAVALAVAIILVLLPAIAEAAA